MDEDAPRYTALWDRLETLVTAFVEMFWRQIVQEEKETVATNDSEEAYPPASARKTSRTGRAKEDPPTSLPGPTVAAFAPLYPPDAEHPARPGPILRDLVQIIVCLRRIQDARFALDQKATGEYSHGSAEERSDSSTVLVGIPEDLKESFRLGAERTLEGEVRD